MIGSCAEELLGTGVPTNVPLMSFGMDSLAITAFTNLISDRLDVEVLATVVFDHPTLDSLAACLMGFKQADDHVLDPDVPIEGKQMESS